jgi:epoxyqueuosine reductase
VKSILMLATNYRSAEPADVGPGQARISRHAWGADYHEVLRERLRTLGQFYRRLVPTARVRGVVDTAPLLERRFGQLAGLGWIGKNTLLINQRLGSWFFLAALLTTEELANDEPFAADHCGSCRECLDACPTGALVAPHRLDARKCISYQTIELRRTTPKEHRAAGDDRVFGCDVCQEACPWNRHTPATTDRAFYPRPSSPLMPD